MTTYGITINEPGTGKRVRCRLSGSSQPFYTTDIEDAKDLKDSFIRFGCFNPRIIKIKD